MNPEKRFMKMEKMSAAKKKNYSCDKMNKICRMENILPTKKIAELEIQKLYEVNVLKEIKTCYGLKIVVELDSSFQIWLPERIGTAFLQDRDELAAYETLAKEGSLYIRFLDKKFNKCEFVTVDDD
uniref:CoaA protein n=1 Tax=Fopius arisanus TaxID=64838 RepID=A0A0C9RC75_9HYME